jgi:hypothetical protein
MELPDSDKINIAGLSASFKSMTNSYKFFWLWAILDDITANGDKAISFESLSKRMLSLVWYPLDYFKLSFGKQDSFKNIAAYIAAALTIDNTINSKPLFIQIREGLPFTEATKIEQEVNDTLKRYVICRYLSSFYPNQLNGLKDYQINGKIRKLSNDPLFKNAAPYVIETDRIIINDPWFDYFEKHSVILKGFIKWNLIQFLQKHNPYVIGLSEKLEKPVLRDLSLAKSFWKKYIRENPTNCIYSNSSVAASSISLDHFIPWSYVAHDRLWNVIPTLKSVNSSKSDILPSLEYYFEPFCELQFKATKFHLEKGNIQYLEDLHSIIDFTDLNALSLSEFKNLLLPEIENNIRTAKNLGFNYPFIFKGSSIS